MPAPPSSPTRQDRTIFPTPDVRDYILTEVVDGTQVQQDIPAFGDPHPDTVAHPDHKFTHAEQIDEEGLFYKYYYAADRDAQDAYNYDIVNGSFLTRTYVIPRSLYFGRHESDPAVQAYASGTLDFSSFVDPANQDPATVIIGADTINYTYDGSAPWATNAINTTEATAATNALNVNATPTSGGAITIGSSVITYTEGGSGPWEANAIRASVDESASNTLNVRGVPTNGETVTIGSDVITYTENGSAPWATNAINAVTGTAASGTLTMTGVPLEGEIVTVGTTPITYTYGGSAPWTANTINVSDGEKASGTLTAIRTPLAYDTILIGSDSIEVVIDEVPGAYVADNVINVNTGTATITTATYATAISEFVSGAASSQTGWVFDYRALVEPVTASVLGTVVTIITESGGVAGNSIVLSSSGAFTASGATLTGGEASPATISATTYATALSEFINGYGSSQEGWSFEDRDFTEDVVASSASGVLTVTCGSLGVAGDAIATTTDLTNGSWGAATLGGGVDGAALVTPDAFALALKQFINGEACSLVGWSFEASSFPSTLTATVNANLLTVSVDAAGAAGNAIATTETCADSFWDFPTMTGGVDGTATITRETFTQAMIEFINGGPSTQAGWTFESRTFAEDISSLALYGVPFLSIAHGTAGSAGGDVVTLSNMDGITWSNDGTMFGGTDAATLTPAAAALAFKEFINGEASSQTGWEFQARSLSGDVTASASGGVLTVTAVAQGVAGNSIATSGGWLWGAATLEGGSAPAVSGEFTYPDAGAASPDSVFTDYCFIDDSVGRLEKDLDGVYIKIVRRFVRPLEVSYRYDDNFERYIKITKEVIPLSAVTAPVVEAGKTVEIQEGNLFHSVRITSELSPNGAYPYAISTVYSTQNFSFPPVLESAGINSAWAHADNGMDRPSHSEQFSFSYKMKNARPGPYASVILRYITDDPESVINTFPLYTVPAPSRKTMNLWSWWAYAGNYGNATSATSRDFATPPSIGSPIVATATGTGGRGSSGPTTSNIDGTEGFEQLLEVSQHSTNHHITVNYGIKALPMKLWEVSVIRLDITGIY